MTTTNLTALIDAYAAIKTQMGRLEVEKKRLETALAELPAGAYESEDNRLTITDSVRTSDDEMLKDQLKAIVEAYRARLSHQYLTAHTTETTVRTHRVGLPTGKGLAA
jgi:predicted nuclease with TOPRIM domain